MPTPALVVDLRLCHSVFQFVIVSQGKTYSLNLFSENLHIVCAIDL